MLRFTSYFPMASFLKTELEFGDEKLTHKYKSLTGEGENEIPYSKIAHIRFERWADIRWATTGAALAVVTYFLLIVLLCYLFPEMRGNSVLLGIGRSFFLAGIVLIIPGFIKRDFCSFHNNDLRVVAVIAITSKNLDDVYAAAEFVKTKTTILSETYPDLLDEEKAPRFENVVYFLPNYLNKNTTLFYDDKILDMEKSLLGESASEYKYSNLTQKILISKHGDGDWGTVTGLVVVIWLLVDLGLKLFFPDVETGINLLFVAAGLGLISIFMGYVKNEVVSFYDKNDDVVFNINIPPGKKQEVEEIIQFVKTKISETSGA